MEGSNFVFLVVYKREILTKNTHVMIMKILLT